MIEYRRCAVCQTTYWSADSIDSVNPLCWRHRRGAVLKRDVKRQADLEAERHKERSREERPERPQTSSDRPRKRARRRRRP